MLMYYTKHYSLKEKELSMKEAIEEYWKVYPEMKIQNICVDVNEIENKLEYWKKKLSTAWEDGDSIFIIASRKSQGELLDIRYWLSEQGIKYNKLVS